MEKIMPEDKGTITTGAGNHASNCECKYCTFGGDGPVQWSDNDYPSDAGSIATAAGAHSSGCECSWCCFGGDGPVKWAGQ